MIFQEPMTALNPLYTVGNQIGEVLELHEGLRKQQARATRDRAAGAHRHPRPASAASTPIRTSCRAASASAR